MVELEAPHRRVLILLAALATGPGRERSRDQLVEALWPEHDLDRALANLRPALSLARRLIREACSVEADPLPRRGAFYRLSPEFAWRIDAETFRELVVATRPRHGAAPGDAGPRDAAEPVGPEPPRQPEQGGDSGPGSERAEASRRQWLLRTRDRLEQAWKLYRGVFLSGCAVTPWVREERSRFETLWDEMLLRLGAVHVELGELDRALDSFRTIVAFDPTREDAHLSVMRIFSRQGRPDLVRRQYDQMCRHLLDELESRPLDSTARRYYALLSSPEDAAAPW